VSVKTGEPPLATNKGTDRPWQRPGHAAQDLKPALPDRETRQRQYEDMIGDADNAPYQQEPSPAASAPRYPARQSSAVGEEGRVGEPLPIVLLVIAAIPIVGLIVGLIWWVAS